MYFISPSAVPRLVPGQVGSADLAEGAMILGLWAVSGQVGDVQTCRRPALCQESWGLKLIFLIVSRAVSLLRLSRRESWWKDAEIFMLRHQLSVALRERPRAHSRLTWPDRAWLALLAGTLADRRELLDRTLIWNQRHLIIVLREYEDFYNTHRPHQTLSQAAPLRPLPDSVADLEQFRVQRRDRAGGVIHEYRLAA
jgi:hypothetical protein